MQTLLSDILNTYGVESGLITPEPAVVEIPPDDNDTIDGDLSQLIEHSANEIDRGVALVQSLDSMSERVEAGDITEAAMESYRFNLECLLRSSGLGIPVDLIAPSFEAAEADKKTVGQKVKGAIDAAIKWIREKVKALLALFTRGSAKTKAKAEEAKKAEEDAKAYAKKYSDDGIKRLASDGFAEKYKSQEGSGVKVKSMKRLPGWMVKGDQINWGELDKIIAVCNGTQVKNLMQGEVKGGTPDHFRTEIGHIMASFPANGNGDDNKQEYEVDIPKIAEYIGKFTACIVSIHGQSEDLQGTIKGMEKRIARFESQGREMKPEEKKQILDDIQVFSMAVAAADRIIMRPALVLKWLKGILA